MSPLQHLRAAQLRGLITNAQQLVAHLQHLLTCGEGTTESDALAAKLEAAEQRLAAYRAELDGFASTA